MSSKYITVYCLLMLLVCLPMTLFSDDRLAATYASFGPDGFNNYKYVVDHNKALGFKKISLVPTYYYEHLNAIEDKYTPPIETIKACINYLIEKEFQIIYKPHIDPVRYLANYNIFLSDNASWRVNVTWRGFFDIDPVKSQYYEVIILPVLRCLKEIYEQKQKENANQLPSVRLELGAELMNSMICHSDKWVKVAQKARKFVKSNKLSNFIKLSHNFTHHIQIEEDYLLRMNKTEKKWLRKYIKCLDEVSVSQYMDLTIFASKDQASMNTLIHSVAKAILFYHQRFRELILGEHLKVKNFRTLPVNIGEFGIGVGGLKHPNYWEGNKLDKSEQDVGIRGLLESLRKFKEIENEKHLDATIWTVGPQYDIFGLFYSEGVNKAALNHIKKFLEE